MNTKLYQYYFNPPRVTVTHQVCQEVKQVETAFKIARTCIDQRLKQLVKQVKDQIEEPMDHHAMRNSKRCGKIGC
jgi:hypothetical protein